MAAIAGARRSASSVTRFHDAAQSRDVFVSGADDDPEPLDRVLSGPLVEDHLDLLFVFGSIKGDPDTFTFAPTDPSGLQIERGVLLEGRRADPDDPHEIVLTETTARRYGFDAGDTFELLTISPEQVADVFEGKEVTVLEGPVIPLRVTGVALTGDDLATRRDAPAVIVLSPAFLDRYGDSVGTGFASHMVRLSAGPSGVERFTEVVQQDYGGSEQAGLSIDASQGEKAIAESLGVITAALVALALVIGIAGLGWAAFTAARQQRLSADAVDVLGALGSTPSERRNLLAGSVLPALVVGSLVAPVVAVALSPRFPVGLARQIDPDVGIHADATVLVVGVIVLVVVPGLASLISAARLTRTASTVPGAVRPSRLLDRVVMWLSPAPATGVRFALSNQRPGRAPVRPAVVGACLSVVGLVGIAVVGASLDRLVATPARWGTTWDVTVTPAEEEVDRSSVADDPDVSAAAVGLFDDQVTLGGEQMTAMTIDPVKGDISPTLVRGRAPRSDDEVAVGQDTLDALDVRLGTRVAIASRSSGRKEFRLVGVVVFPTLDFPAALDQGAAFTREGGDRLLLGDPDREDAGSQKLLIRWAPGVDRGAAVRELRGEGATVVAPVASSEVRGLTGVERFPVLAAASLILLGVIATSHALAVTVRRRRSELAVLSALGFTPRQRAIAIAAQATAIAIVALLVGAVLGVVGGRVVWSVVAGALGIADDAAYPLTILALGAVGWIVVLNLIGVVPARAAHRLRLGAALRSEEGPRQRTAHR